MLVSEAAKMLKSMQPLAPRILDSRGRCGVPNVPSSRKERVPEDLKIRHRRAAPAE